MPRFRLQCRAVKLAPAVVVAMTMSPATLPTPAAAQTAADQKPVTNQLRFFYDIGKGLIRQCAEKMPESGYGFRITPDNRSFGETLAHVADGNYNFCSASLARKNPYPDVVQGTPGVLEKTRTAKKDILEALEASFAHCDAAFDAATDATLTEEVPFTSVSGTQRVPRARALTLVSFHASWMYGHLAMYLRAKGIVPPYTETLMKMRQGS